MQILFLISDACFGHACSKYFLSCSDRGRKLGEWERGRGAGGEDRQW